MAVFQLLRFVLLAIVYLNFTPKALAPIEFVAQAQDEPAIVHEWTKEDIKNYVYQTALENKEVFSHYLVTPEKWVQIVSNESGFRQDCFPDIGGYSCGTYSIHDVHFRATDKTYTTKECALDVVCSTQWAIQRVKEGEIWRWSEYWKVIFGIDPIKELPLRNNILRYSPIFQKKGLDF